MTKKITNRTKIDNYKSTIKPKAKKPQPETNGDTWSQKQQKALEIAMRKHPSSIPANERWENIAGDVKGKDKRECVLRFKALRAALKKNKRPAKK